MERNLCASGFRECQHLGLRIRLGETPSPCPTTRNSDLWNRAFHSGISHHYESIAYINHHTFVLSFGHVPPLQTLVRKHCPTRLGINPSSPERVDNISTRKLWYILNVIRAHAFVWRLSNKPQSYSVGENFSSRGRVDTINTHKVCAFSISFEHIP